jgi:hypothetical protein
MFGPSDNFQPSLIYAGKSQQPTLWRSTRKLAILIRVDTLAKDKCSSSFFLFDCDEEKRF